MITAALSLLMLISPVRSSDETFTVVTLWFMKPFEVPANGNSVVFKGGKRSEASPAELKKMSDYCAIRNLAKKSVSLKAKTSLSTDPSWGDGKGIDFKVLTPGFTLAVHCDFTGTSFNGEDLAGKVKAHLGEWGSANE